MGVMGQRTILQDLAVQQRREKRTVGVRSGLESNSNWERNKGVRGDRKNLRVQPMALTLEMSEESVESFLYIKKS